MEPQIQRLKEPDYLQLLTCARQHTRPLKTRPRLLELCLFLTGSYQAVSRPLSGRKKKKTPFAQLSVYSISILEFKFLMEFSLQFAARGVQKFLVCTTFLI